MLDEQAPPRSTDKLTRTANLRRWIIGVGVAAMVGIVASAAYDAWRSYDQLTTNTDRELSNVGTALAEQLGSNLKAIDVLLKATASWYLDLPPGTTTQAVDADLASRAAELPHVALLSITDDAQGMRRYRSRESAAVDFSVTDRSYFIAQRDRRGTTPLHQRADRHALRWRPGFVLSRRLEDAQGNFAGVVAAIVELDDYQQFYRAINLGTKSAISLFRDDGTLVLRQPPTPELVGKQFPSVVELAKMPTKSTVARTLSPIDAYRASRSFPACRIFRC